MIQRRTGVRRLFLRTGVRAAWITSCGRVNTQVQFSNLQSASYNGPQGGDAIKRNTKSIYRLTAGMLLSPEALGGACL